MKLDELIAYLWKEIHGEDIPSDVLQELISLTSMIYMGTASLSVVREILQEKKAEQEVAGLDPRETDEGLMFHFLDETLPYLVMSVYTNTDVEPNLLEPIGFVPTREQMADALGLPVEAVEYGKEDIERFTEKLPPAQSEVVAGVDVAQGQVITPNAFEDLTRQFHAWLNVMYGMAELPAEHQDLAQLRSYLSEKDELPSIDSLEAIELINAMNSGDLEFTSPRLNLFMRTLGFPVAPGSDVLEAGFEDVINRLRAQGTPRVFVNYVKEHKQDLLQEWKIIARADPTLLLVGTPGFVNYFFGVENQPGLLDTTFRPQFQAELNETIARLQETQAKEQAEVFKRHEAEQEALRQIETRETERRIAQNVPTRLEVFKILGGDATRLSMQDPYDLTLWDISNALTLEAVSLYEDDPETFNLVSYTSNVFTEEQLPTREQFTTIRAGEEETPTQLTPQETQQLLSTRLRAELSVAPPRAQADVAAQLEQQGAQALAEFQSSQRDIERQLLVLEQEQKKFEETSPLGITGEALSPPDEARIRFGLSTQMEAQRSALLRNLGTFEEFLRKRKFDVTIAPKAQRTIMVF